MTKVYDTTNFTLYILLESIDVMLLTFTRQGYRMLKKPDRLNSMTGRLSIMTGYSQTK